MSLFCGGGVTALGAMIVVGESGFGLVRMRKCQVVDVRFEEGGARRKKGQPALGRTSQVHSYLKAS